MTLVQRIACGLVVLSLAGASGCVVRERGEASYYVDEEPPPPQQVVVETRPGYVYLQGYWYRDGGRWAWWNGRWEAQRANSDWQAGIWVRDGRRWRWNPGRWQGRQERRFERRQERRQFRNGRWR